MNVAGTVALALLLQVPTLGGGGGIEQPVAYPPALNVSVRSRSEHETTLGATMYRDGDRDSLNGRRCG